MNDAFPNKMLFHDKHDEDALDFEAEDGECADEKEEKPAETKEPENKAKKDSDGEIEVSKTKM